MSQPASCLHCLNNSTGLCWYHDQSPEGTSRTGTQCTGTTVTCYSTTPPCPHSRATYDTIYCRLFGIQIAYRVYKFCYDCKHFIPHQSRWHILWVILRLNKNESNVSNCGRKIHVVTGAASLHNGAVKNLSNKSATKLSNSRQTWQHLITSTQDFTQIVK